MEQVKQTLIGIFLGMGCYAVGVELVGVFFSDDLLSYSLGLLLGTIVAVLLVIHMAKTLDKALDMPEAQATKYARKQSFFRLFIMLVAGVVGLSCSKVKFISLVLGILGIKIGALFAPFFLKRIYPEHYTTQEEQY